MIILCGRLRILLILLMVLMAKKGITPLDVKNELCGGGDDGFLGVVKNINDEW